MIIKINIKDISQTSDSPITNYCRQLINNGEDSNTKLEVYREHSDPDVIVTNIGLAATIIASGGRFIKYRS